ncbi:multiple epidermal growth factor-like domains 10 [Elysia marginata]|uniref:Multiple epidermal growth factor-like domains 10 n=1 Tax=Elysia marginata TaxID=1093978 RepID=A0AAV4IMJ7_9GAST|nr:multiple epidermal growth factor-like domains 10 [Elysia marginata]
MDRTMPVTALMAPAPMVVKTVIEVTCAIHHVILENTDLTVHKSVTPTVLGWTMSVTILLGPAPMDVKTVTEGICVTRRVLSGSMNIAVYKPAIINVLGRTMPVTTLMGPALMAVKTVMSGTCAKDQVSNPGPLDPKAERLPLDHDATRTCSVGKYGPSCSKTCNTNCAGSDNACDHINGTCTNGCEDGYRSNMCDKLCPIGKYGSRCLQTCNTNCAGTDDACDHINGTCTNGCEDGYIGEKCDRNCLPGTYGLDCKMNCSIHCAGPDHACNSASGSCDLGCEPGYQESQCLEICPKGRYGLGCNQTCSIQCAGPGNPCHHVNGSCYLGCVHDDQSLICGSEKKSVTTNAGVDYNQSTDREGLHEYNRSTQNTWGIAATVVAVIIACAAAVVIVLLVRRNRNTSKGQTDPTSSSTIAQNMELELKCNVQVESKHGQEEDGTSKIEDPGNAIHWLKALSNLFTCTKPTVTIMQPQTKWSKTLKPVRIHYPTT